MYVLLRLKVYIINNRRIQLKSPLIISHIRRFTLVKQWYYKINYKIKEFHTNLTFIV